MITDLRERERERVVASCTCPDWGQNHNLGMCPDEESNLQPLGVQVDAPTNCATWPGL